MIVNIAETFKGMLTIYSAINKTYYQSLSLCCLIANKFFGVGEAIYSNNKLRDKCLWKFIVLYGISRQPIVGNFYPAPTLLSIFLLCMLLAEPTQTYCSEREKKEKKG